MAARLTMMGWAIFAGGQMILARQTRKPQTTRASPGNPDIDPERGRYGLDSGSSGQALSG
jgi:hypothetical protein